MKKLYILLLFFPFFAKGTLYTSVANGDWATPTTWNPNGIPGVNDDVIINNSVTITAGITKCNNLTISSGGILNNSVTFAVYNIAANNIGGTWQGGGAVYFGGPINGTFLIGGGNFNGQVGNWYFCGNTSAPVTATEAIDPTINITKNGGNIYISTFAYNRTVRILNFGKISMSGGALLNMGNLPCSWNQEPNSLLTVVNPLLTNSYDTLVASATNNNVTYSANTNFTIKNPFGSTYYTIHFNNGIKTFPASLTVKGLFQLDAPDGAVNFAGFNVTVGGNWINNSISIPTNFTGTVTFNGSAAQTIGGTKSTRFPNITISGTGGVNLATGGSFTGVMTLNNTANFSSSAGIYDTLISTSGSTARVAQITGTGTITANFIVQRYDGRVTAQYQILSSPVQSTNLGDWNISNRNPKFYMSGVGGPDGQAGNYVSVYLFDEPTNAYNPVTTFSNPGINYVLPQGQGIYLWMGNNLVSMSPFSYITHGVPSVGNISRNATFTFGPGKGNGFNIIGNPYPSPISWSSFLASNASLQASYYIFEQDGSWHTFGGGNIIPMEQGFGIVTSSSTALSFQESHKSNVDAALLRVGDPSKEDNSATFTLSDDANNFSCPTIISFRDNYTSLYTPKEDAIFINSFINEVPKLYTVSGDERNLALNRLPDADNELDIPLTAIGNVAANYTLSTQNISNVSSYNCVCLIDKSTGTMLNNFEDNATYTFNISTPGEEKDFILRFTKLSSGESCNTVTTASSINNSPENIQIYPSPSGATIKFQLAQPEDAIVSAYSLTGQKIIEDIHTNVYNNQLTVVLPSSVEIYSIRIHTPNGITLKKMYR